MHSVDGDLAKRRPGIVLPFSAEASRGERRGLFGDVLLDV